MNDWRQKFLQQLETAKKSWQAKFQDFAGQSIDPVFAEFEEFTNGNGFTVTQPVSEDGTRHFKFALTENGYVLLAFRMHGLEDVEVCYEVVVPGADGPTSITKSARFSDAGQRWVEHQFEQGLDRFMAQFCEAGGALPGKRAGRKELAKA